MRYYHTHILTCDIKFNIKRVTHLKSVVANMTVEMDCMCWCQRQRKGGVPCV